MTDFIIAVGPLDLEGIARACTPSPKADSQLVDMPQSIRLARAAQMSRGTFESDISLTWLRDGLPIAYSPMGLHRDANGSLVLHGIPHPLRLPAIHPRLNEQTRRHILDSFRNHVATELSRIEATAAHVWVPISGELHRGSIEARWLSKVPTVGSGVSLDVDLAVESEHAWSGLRKRYRSLINSGLRNLSTTFVTQCNKDSEISAGVDVLAGLHAEASGRVVYDDRLWDVATGLVRAGSAACVLVHAETIAVGGILLILNEPRSSYALGAFDRELMSAKLPVGHVALWSAISWLGEQGFTRLSLGAVPTPPPVEGKEAGIDQFKRGFATVLSPWVVTSIEATG